MSIKTGAMRAAAAMVLGSTAATVQQAPANQTVQAKEGRKISDQMRFNLVGGTNNRPVD